MTRPIMEFAMTKNESSGFRACLTYPLHRYIRACVVYDSVCMYSRYTKGEQVGTRRVKPKPMQSAIQIEVRGLVGLRCYPDPSNFIIIIVIAVGLRCLFCCFSQKKKNMKNLKKCLYFSQTERKSC